MTNLWLDIRYTLRQLRTAPGFTLTVVLTLALGIGANSAIFTLVHAILMNSLPVTDPAQLWRIGDTDDCCVEGGFPADSSTTGDVSIFSYDLFQNLKANAPEFEQLAAVQAGGQRWSVRRGSEQAKPVGSEFVTGNYFEALGVGAYAGRMFSGSDDTPSSAPVVVLSYQAWQNKFGSDRSIVGSTIYIQTKPFTVVGIAPAGFFGDRVSSAPPELWAPVEMEPYVNGAGSYLHHPISHWLYPVGRVRPGTNIPALQAKMSATLRQWLATQTVLTAHGGGAVIPRMHVVMTPGGGGIQRMQIQTGKSLKLLMILSSVVLLIACANIANLLLARATTKRPSVALRMALGAGRRRVMVQTLTESVLLGLIGGVAGLGVAYLGCRTILALAFPNARNMTIDPSPSLEVLGFTFLVSLVTGMLFGAGPAWLSSHAQPAEALRGVNRATKDRSSLPQKSLVVFQAALSVVLLTAAILVTKSLTELEHQDFGIKTANRYVVHIDPMGAGYSAERLPALYRQMEDRFGSLPGVTSFSLATYSPLEGDNWGECVIPQGHPAPSPGDHCGSTWARVSNHFLDSIGVPMVRGRNFTDQDAPGSPMVSIVNQAFARKFFPGKDPIGQHFGLDDVKYSSAFEIVGVFADFKMNEPRSEQHAVFLRPLTQQFAYKESFMGTTEAQSINMGAMIVAFNGPQQDVDQLLRRTLAEIDPNLTIFRLEPFEEQVEGNFTQERLIARLTSLFGILALVLASVGLYGVMSYFVAQRTSEIGIRMALGATRKSVVSMVMRGAMMQILIGLVLGIPAALYAGYLMKVMLYGVDSYDPVAITGAPLMLVLCAALAGFIPARRAASIDPMQALRTE
jgi:predicted permease